MERTQILSSVTAGATLPLWVPLLTPYFPDTADVDTKRLARHAAVVRAHTPLWMVAGPTGDGNELDDRQFDQLLAAFTGPLREELQGRVLLALLAPTTQAALARLERVHAALGTSSSAPFEANLERLRDLGWVGLCICPPTGESVDQDSITRHVEVISQHAQMPLALGQLPPATGGRIEVDTFEALIDAHPEIILFADFSGEDHVAPSAPLMDSPVLLRGYENAYSTALRTAGGNYDGLLLGSANNFGNELTGIVRATLASRLEAAQSHAEALQRRVGEFLAIAAEAPVGNASANAQRAVDHAMAYGRRALEVPPPTLFDASRMPGSIVEATVNVLERDHRWPEVGYLDVDVD